MKENLLWGKFAKSLIWLEDNLVRDFERENNVLLDAEKQIKKEDREKEWELER